MSYTVSYHRCIVGVFAVSNLWRGAPSNQINITKQDENDTIRFFKRIKMK
jgi:hypothetical protein